MHRQLLWGAAIGLALLAAVPAQAQDRTTRLYAPFVEWSATNSSYAGNPFDLQATATFTHLRSGQQIVTGLFYAGDDVWKWRFTGIKVGDWTFVTHSDDSDLDGITGRVTVQPNPTPNRYGFTQACGTKWCRPRATDGKLEAFVPQLAMTGNQLDSYTPAYIDGQIRTFLVDHGFNGLHVPSVAGRWFDAMGGQDVERDKQNPDPRAFQALERLIAAVHAAGGVVHIWAWGDSAHGWTCRELAGGCNGEQDRRLQRYIAARLGPLPGWSMGYGFDLDEWAYASDHPERLVEPWLRYLHERSGWKHRLGGRPEGPNRGTDHTRDVGWNKSLDYASYEHWEPTYAVYRAALAATLNGAPLGKPVMSEDRFRIRPGAARTGNKDYTMEQVRRGLWLSTMAGGVGNIWGDLDPAPATGGGSRAFDNPAWVKTYAGFWRDRHHNRFRLDSEPANSCTAGPDARQYGLISDRSHLLVVYAEDTARITLNLATLALRAGWGDTPLSAVAVDTRANYREITLGQLTLKNQTLDLSAHGVSDWAIALAPTGQVGAPSPGANRGQEAPLLRGSGIHQQRGPR
jgi:hypothetical protein